MFPSKDEPLLVWWNAFLLLNLGLHVIDGVGALHLQHDRLPGQGFDEDLHSFAELQNKVKSGLFLNIVVGESMAVFQLLSGEDQSLLIGWDAFLVLDLGLQGDGLAGQSFHEDLHLFEREICEILRFREIFG